MKKLAGFILVTLLFITCACDFNVYDDDAAIAKGSGSLFQESYVNSAGRTYNHSFRGFTGVSTVKSLSLNENDEILLTISIESGRFKVVLVEKSTLEVTVLAEGSGEKGASGYSGEFFLKIVGEEAVGSVSIVF